MTATNRFSSTPACVKSLTDEASLWRCGTSLHAYIPSAGLTLAPSHTDRHRISLRLRSIGRPVEDHYRVLFFTGLWLCVALSCLLALSM